MKPLLILLLVFCCINCSAQRIVTFAQKFTISPFTEGKIECLLPGSKTGKQSAIRLEYSRLPDDTLRRYGGLLAVWNVTETSHIQEITVLSTLKLTENSFRMAKIHSPIAENEHDLSLFLQPEEMIQSDDDKIVEMGSSLRGVNEIETAKNIFEFTRDHLEYHNFNNSHQGAKRALKKGRGDCTEYAELMIALLRSLGIPSRLVMGVTLHTEKEKRFGFHNWVEVYFRELGWVSFDPTWADHENSFTTFEKMKNCYIQLGYGHAASGYRYWTDATSYQVVYSANWENAANEIDRRVQMYLYGNNVKSAHRSLDTLLTWLPTDSRYLGFKAKSFMREGEFEKALPFIQLSVRNAKGQWEKSLCKMNLAEYYANVGHETDAMNLLLEVEKMDEYHSTVIFLEPLFNPLHDLDEFKQLVKRGKVLSQKMGEEHKERIRKKEVKNE